MLTKDNKLICCFNFVDSSLKNQGCVSYDVFVDLPKVSYDLAHIDKSSYSRHN